MATAVYEEVLDRFQEDMVLVHKESRELWEEWVASVAHVFVELGGDPVTPSAAQLVFISERPLSAGLIEQLELRWEAILGGKHAGLAVLRNRYLTFDEVRFVEFRRWYEVDQTRLAGS